MLDESPNHEAKAEFITTSLAINKFAGLAQLIQTRIPQEKVKKFLSFRSQARLLYIANRYPGINIIACAKYDLHVTPQRNGRITRTRNLSQFRPILPSN